MATATYPDLGRVWLPNPTLSLPGRPSVPKYSGVVVASQRRPLWSLRGELPHIAALQIEQPWPSSEAVLRNLLAPYRDQIDPKLFQTECIWTSVTHNERVNKGAAIQVNRVFGTVGTAPAGVISSIAVANTSYTTTTATDLSIGTITPSVTTNEFTTAGLSRATGTVQNFVAASVLNGVFSVDIVKSFSVSTGATAHGAALFDSNTPSGSFMYCSDIFSADAICVNGDSLVVTWTVSN